MTDFRVARKPLFVLITLTFLVILQTTTALALESWTEQQMTSHEIAELARSLNLPEDNPIIVEAKRLWHEDYEIQKQVQAPAPIYTDADAVIIAKIMSSECGSIQSDTEKACIA